MITINIVDKIINSLEVPEVLSAVSKLTVLSDINIFVENHKGVIEYESNEIKIKLDKKILCVMGVDLAIDFLSESSLGICGKIHSIAFQ